jgi:Adenylate and Guanylate cyclase catalytic domain
MAVKAKASQAAANSLPRRHSEPTLFRDCDESMNNSDLSLDTVGVRRKMNRRRSHGSRRTTFDEKPLVGDTADNAKVLVTWREITTGVLLLCAFLTCLSVFFLLGGESQDARESTSNCESRTFLQQKLISYLAKGEGLEDFATFQNANDMNSTCSYSFNICSDNPNLAVTIENLETTLYILLVGALLTVVGVAVLFYDDSEDAMMQLWMANSIITPSRFMTDLSEHNSSWGGHASFRRNAMADLFPDTSVLFADIVGFEAWSSQREPTQCLTLLETIYDAFDRLAKKQGIFKVEAVADCYTAAAGLPDARSDHAEALLQFAHDCRECFKQSTKALEVTLGPDTSDLSLRVGIHRYVSMDSRGCITLFPGC